MKSLFCLAGIVGVLMCGGCASIVSKSQWPVSINSNPGGATVTIKNRTGMEVHKGITPTIVTLSSYGGFFSSADYQCYFEKDGYYPTTVPLSSRLNAWYIGNIIFGGCIGLLIVDPATGAMWKLDEFVTANLAENPSVSNKVPTKDVSEEANPNKSDAPSAAVPVQENPSASNQVPMKDVSEDVNPPTSDASSSDIPTQLKKLKELKDLGVLTDEEYEMRRKALVEKL